MPKKESLTPFSDYVEYMEKGDEPSRQVEVDGPTNNCLMVPEQKRKSMRQENKKILKPSSQKVKEILIMNNPSIDYDDENS